MTEITKNGKTAIIENGTSINHYEVSFGFIEYKRSNPDSKPFKSFTCTRASKTYKSKKTAERAITKWLNE